MKVSLVKITDETLVLEETVDAVSWDLDTNDVKFIENLDIKAIFKKIGSEILVEIILKAVKEVTCGRCLETVILKDEYGFMLSYSTHEIEDELDLDVDIREEILLNWPMKPLCSDECKGLDIKTGRKIN